MKIAVIGYTGSGKSVLAAKLGKIIGCPVLHLDKLQFEAGWKERGEAEGKILCEQFLEENKDRGWVIDGNYEKSMCNLTNNLFFYYLFLMKIV